MISLHKLITCIGTVLEKHISCLLWTTRSCKLHCMIRPWGKATCPRPSTIFHSNNIRNGSEGPVMLLYKDEILEPGPNST